MPRSSSVSEKVWAQAIHAVTVQKMSLRRAAQLYGVHHMSLHRRVRGRYVSPSTARFADEFQLSRAEEDEAISVLREQFIHEHLVTSDDVRYVVRTIACQNGRRDIPSDFPQNRWIASFKRMYGFSKPSSSSAHEQQQQLPRADSMSSNNTSTSGNSGISGSYEGDSPHYSSGSSPGDQDQAAYNSPAPPALQRSQVDSPMYSSRSSVPTQGSYARSSMGSPMFDSLPQHASRMSYLAPPPSQPSMVTMQMASNSSMNNGDEQRDDTSESDSEHNRESMEQEDRLAEEKRCRQSNTVSAETWEKAMDAVEIHGMSLRNAAKAYGVHFAALHRRVKKRALKKESTPPLENYIPFEDEAGIVRVIHARADLGIIMSYEELVELLNRTALKYSPMITVDLSRSLVRRFQSRVEQSIRHLIRDWPLPRLDTLCHFQSTPTNNLAAVAAAAAFAEEKMSSPLTQRAMPPIYVRNAEFNNSADPHRLSISDPFMRPMYRGDQESSNKAMMSPNSLQERLASPRGSQRPQLLTCDARLDQRDVLVAQHRVRVAAQRRDEVRRREERMLSVRHQRVRVHYRPLVHAHTSRSNSQREAALKDARRRPVRYSVRLIWPSIYFQQLLRGVDEATGEQGKREPQTEGDAPLGREDRGRAAVATV